MTQEAALDLTVKLESVSACQKELKVRVPREEIDSEFDSVYLDLKKRAAVPGFRVGFAPRDLLERYHGQKAREEVLHRLVQRSLEEALRQKGPLNLVRRPVVSEVQFDPKADLSYSAKLEVAPEVPLGRYKGLSLKRARLEVAESELQEALSRLRASQAQLVPVLEDRPAAEGDFLLADVTESPKAGAPVQRRDLLIQLDLKNDPAGVSKELVGIAPGQKRRVNLKEGVSLSVELKSLKAKRLPDLDDAFAKSVGPFDSLEALKQMIRENLKREKETAQRRGLEGQAAQQLLEGWNFEVPASLVGSQAQRLLKERALELLNQGIPPSEVESRALGLTDQAKLEALKSVKLFFILRRIAAAEGITVSEQEMSARMQAMAQRLNVPADQLEKDLRARDLLEELGWEILRAKVTDLLLREAKIEES